MYIKRHLEEQVLSASNQLPVVMVCGQRQVGKSTMLNHIQERDRHYVTLDDRNALRLAENDPALFFETYGSPLLIDEIQRAPSLLLEIKRIVDAKDLTGDDNAGMFWLTGSQKFQMMKGVSESLAGRTAVFELSSFSLAEMEGRSSGPFFPDIDQLRRRVREAEKKDIHQIYEEIFLGSMPKLRTTDLDRDRFYMDYVNTYLERDIKDLSQVGKLDQFYDFLVCMAARTGQELHVHEIAKAVGVSDPTVKSWVSILERSGVIFLLHPYYTNITKRQVKTPKVYFLDTGLAAWLCRWSDAATLESGAASGAFFETYVVSEIVKSTLNAGKPADFYYYRDTDQKEIDLLFARGNSLYPVEIKKAKEPADPDRNFSVLQKFGMDVKEGVVLCMSDELMPINRNVWMCPVWAI